MFAGQDDGSDNGSANNVKICHMSEMRTIFYDKSDSLLFEFCKNCFLSTDFFVTTLLGCFLAIIFPVF